MAGLHAVHGGAPREDPLAVHAHVVQDLAGRLAADRVVVGHQDAQVPQVLEVERGLLLKLEVQAHRELGPLAVDGLHLDVAAHHPHDVARDGHPQPRALDAGGQLVVGAGEGLEEPLLELLGHAVAVVLEDEGVVAEVGDAGGRLVDRQRDLAAVGGVLDGVGHDVHEDLLDAAGIADDPLVVHAHDRHAEGVAVGLDLRPGHRQRPVDELGQVELLLDELHLAALDLVHVEELVDERQQVVRGVRDLPQAVGHALAVVQVCLGDRGHADDAVHRGADVVAHAGEEVALRFAGGLRGIDRLAQGLLHLALVAHLVVHVLEAADDAEGAVAHLHAGELDVVVALALLENATEGHGVYEALTGALHDGLGLHRRQEALAVLFVDEPGVEGESVGEARDPDRLVGGHQVDHVLVDAEELEALGLDVVDEPHRVVDARECLDHGLAQVERVLDLLLAADLVVHVPEAHHDGALRVAHVEACELDAVVAEPVLEDAPEGDRVEGPAPRALDYGLARHGIEEGLAVLLVDEVGVEGEGLGEAAHPTRGLGRHEVRELLVDAEELEALGLDVVDEPEGVVVARERLDDRAGERTAVLDRLALLGDVRDEDVVEAPVDVGGDVVAVVVDPPHAPVAAHDAVLHVVEVVPGLAHLVTDVAGDALVVLRVHHATEGEARERLELLE